MSRIGKKIIDIPQEVTSTIEGNKVLLKGPKGSLELVIPVSMEVVKQDSHINVVPKQGTENLEKPIRALWGLTRQLVANAIEGITKGYEKKLEIEGVGYRALVEGDTLVLHVGFTNPIKLKIPAGLAITVKEGVVSVLGFEKGVVGQFSANVRSARPVEPYKGKGIRYQGEQVRRKLGKRAAATTGGAGAK